MNSPASSLLPFLCIAIALAGCSTTKQTPASAEKKSSWITLFDGKSADAWRGFKTNDFPEKAWKVEDGTLKTIVGADGDLITKEQFENFELTLEWKISPGGNSGVIYHVSEEFKKPWETGPEMQVLDDAKHRDGQNPKLSAGSLYALIAPENKKLKPVGEWNEARLIVKNNHVEHWLNGAKVVEYELGSPALEELISTSKFKRFPRFAKEKTGYVCLQHHHDEVWYRNIRIRRL